jgi:acyl-CoA synthetase (AMP-forming)/AMP-acid ligase II
VARFGDRTAVEVQRRGGLERFTYNELHAIAVANAEWLACRGVAPGDRCALYAENDAHWCAAYLGILRLGAIAVPLDTNYSAAQIATILSDCGARVLFVNERLAAHAAESGFAGIVCDVHESLRPKPRVRLPPSPRRPRASPTPDSRLPAPDP